MNNSTKVRLLTLTTFLAIISLTLKAVPVLPQDSLALVKLYNATSGTSWTNKNNWLSGPVSTWYGITVTANRVTKVNLPNNKLKGAIPATFNNLTALKSLICNNNNLTEIPSLPALSAMQEIQCHNNELSALPVVGSSILTTLKCYNNNLTFEDLEPFMSLPIFQYAPQKKISEKKTSYIKFGKPLVLSVSCAGSANTYQWFKDGVAVNAPNPSPDFTITFFTASNEGIYTCRVKSPLVPGLTILSEPITADLLGQDSLGGAYISNQLIVEFKESTTPQQRKDLLNYYGATKLDSCLCGVLELWELPDTSYLPGNEIVTGVEETKANASAKPEVEEGGQNYQVYLHSTEATQIIKSQIAQQKASREFARPRPEDNILVAVIDVGIDNTHPQLSSKIWKNPAEKPGNKIDDDGNCLQDDLVGFNFANRNTNSYDDSHSGHGTHVAGIITSGLEDNSSIKLMSLKSHDSEGFGTLFNATCALYYATEKRAKVINLSWGYNGEASGILKNAITRADSVNALVISAAGNGNEAGIGQNNDIIPHYPSSYEAENLIAVAALNPPEDALSDFTNFGQVSVDIAAPGTRITSTAPGGGYNIKDGTSMSAAFVSKTAALLYEKAPNASNKVIKQAILSTATILPSLHNLSTSGKLNSAKALEFMDNFVKNEAENKKLMENAKQSEVLVYPQPFSQEVTLEFPAKNSLAEFKVYNKDGDLIFHSDLSSQKGAYTWNGKDSKNNIVVSGLYFYHLQVGNDFYYGKLIK